MELLRQADVAVSTAQLEYFGIAALEAVVAGAVPLFPNRLSYPEIIGEPWHKAVLYEDDADLAGRLERVIADLATARDDICGLSAWAIERYNWPEVARHYDAFIGSLTQV